jgi:hypothetical protein
VEKREGGPGHRGFVRRLDITPVLVHARDGESRSELASRGPNVFGLHDGAGNRATGANGDQGSGTLTVEIESILVNEELAALLESAEASGQLRQAELNELLEPLELEPLELEVV